MPENPLVKFLSRGAVMLLPLCLVGSLMSSPVSARPAAVHSRTVGHRLASVHVTAGRLYFGCTRLENQQGTNTHPYYLVFPVRRKFVYSGRPETAAVRALIAGPTPGERNRSYYSELAGYRLLRLRFSLAHYRATVALRAIGSASTDLFGVRGARFQEQLVKTLAQFGSIHSVRILINGVLQHPNDL